MSLRAFAFDAATGRQVVDVELFRLDRTNLLNPKNSFASPTPILDGDRVYVHFGAEGTAALTSTGEVLWRTRLPYRSQHGEVGHPSSIEGCSSSTATAMMSRRSSWRSTRRPERNAGGGSGAHPPIRPTRRR